MKRIIFIAMLMIFSCICLSGCGKSKGEKAKEDWEKETQKLRDSSQKPTKPMWK